MCVHADVIICCAHVLLYLLAGSCSGVVGHVWVMFGSCSGGLGHAWVVLGSCSGGLGRA